MVEFINVTPGVFLVGMELVEILSMSHHRETLTTFISSGAFSFYILEGTFT